VVAPLPKLPVVTLLALVDAGAVTDRPGEEGLAQLTARMLSEGAGGRDGERRSRRMSSGLGTAIDTSADWDAALVRLTVLLVTLAGSDAGAGRRVDGAVASGPVSRSGSRANGWPNCCNCGPSRAASRRRHSIVWC